MPPHSLLCPERMIAGITRDSGTNLYQTRTILYAHVRVRSHLFSMYEIYSGWQRACLATRPEDDVTNDSPTILNVDDERDQRLVLATLLEYRGFRVRIARRTRYSRTDGDGTA
jgi:PleD family two-component response regulator